tara:strand:- start:190 stop:624 length:435 start_codon:yes stop_codon:yes gene_type:complete
MASRNYTRTGFSFHNNRGLNNSYAVIPVTRDTTNSPQSVEFPNSGNIQSVQLDLTSISTGGLSVTMYLARDSSGLNIITPSTTSGATQDISYTSGTAVGGVSFAVDTDYHYDSGVANTVEGTIYVVAKLSSGTAIADVRVNWRA